MITDLDREIQNLERDLNRDIQVSESEEEEWSNLTPLDKVPLINLRRALKIYQRTRVHSESPPLFSRNKGNKRIKNIQKVKRELKKQSLESVNSIDEQIISQQMHRQNSRFGSFADSDKHPTIYSQHTNKKPGSHFQPKPHQPAFKHMNSMGSAFRSRNITIGSSFGTKKTINLADKLKSVTKYNLKKKFQFDGFKKTPYMSRTPKQSHSKASRFQTQSIDPQLGDTTKNSHSKKFRNFFKKNPIRKYSPIPSLQGKTIHSGLVEIRDYKNDSTGYKSVKPVKNNSSFVINRQIEQVSQTLQSRDDFSPKSSVKKTTFMINKFEGPFTCSNNKNRQQAPQRDLSIENYTPSSFKRQLQKQFKFNSKYNYDLIKKRNQTENKFATKKINSIANS